MHINRATCLQQGMLNNSWLGVIGSGKLNCNKLETRNTEQQLVSSGRLWEVEVQQT